NIESESVPIDSDEDIDFTARKKHGKQVLRIDESDSEIENDVSLVKTVEANENSDSHHTSRMCDEDSSSDESDKPSINEAVDTKRQKAPQRMSAKQAEEQMKIIQSESQRLARECHLSVPYHKPKQYSLKEFMNRRTINKPVPLALNKKVAATIKMTSEELEQYAKSLAERNKESQEFYRSESENDDKEASPKCETNPVVETSNIVEESAKVSNLATDLSHVTGATKTTSEIIAGIDSEESALESVVKTSNLSANENDVTDLQTNSGTVAEDELSEPNPAEPKETIEIDYYFGENEGNKSQTQNALLPLYGTHTPCLKTPVNGVINLDAEDEKPVKKGSDELFERFMKHAIKKPNRSAKEVGILSATNGVIEWSNIKIESEDQNCIHSKPRKDCFQLKEELSLRIAAMRKEELKKKQMSTIEIPMEGSDSDTDIPTGSRIEGADSKENYESDTVEGGCEIVPKSKERKRVYVLENSDDEEENLPKADDSNLASNSLDDSFYVPEYPPEKTMSQICKNQDLADQMIDSFSKIIPEVPDIPVQSKPDNMSTLFTQTTDNISESQLLDLCSGSFVTQATNLNFVEPETEPTSETQLNRFSDNEFSDDEIGTLKKSKQRKKVNISDDEDEDDKDRDDKDQDDADQNDEVANVMENEESDISDNAPNESDDNLTDEETEAKIVEYDSEENEIEVPTVTKRKIADFFENEAELSESEWGSADEDERNLDKFEMELGDEDEFDQNQLVSELDRIHRRRMLDQDAREVKIIKDTHFEDEEESGLGRQRQYKWKHMENSLNVDDNRTDDADGNENVKSDDESEEMWRRMRYERNNILQETKNRSDTINESKFFVASKTKKRISIVKTSANLNTSETKELSFLISKVTQQQTHRSSLLIRDEKTLANLAKLTTEDDNVPNVNANSRNFLFNVMTADDGKPLGKRKLDDDGTEGDAKGRKVTKRIKKSTLSVLDKM
ncbi:Claspin, partial [Pseudolycoriella hygida]